MAIYKRISGEWVKRTAYQRVSGEWIQISSEAPKSQDYLTFSSPSTFTIATYSKKKSWNGTLEYSIDTNSWNVWDGTIAISSSTDGKLYLRGTGNTCITGSTSYRWVYTGTNISCNGNIETLLDYQAVSNGEHPTMATGCYIGLFYGCTGLISAPELPATTLSTRCYEYMFCNCTKLTIAPELPATTLAEACYSTMFCNTGLTVAPELPATILAKNCYQAMFDSCTSLIIPPALPATTLYTYCYQTMFKGCTSLIALPVLPATTLPDYCYQTMFYGCTNIKLSKTQSDTYSTAYRIPASGTGTNASSSLTNMFYKTGGSFTGTPTKNTTYYTSNTVV